MLNYDLINIGNSLIATWPNYSGSLMKILSDAISRIFNIARSSVFAILLSMHNEKLGMPSPYVKELCSYLTVFRYHLSLFLTNDNNDELRNFLNYVIELFLVNSSLLRPVTVNDLNFLSNDLQYITENSISEFNIKTDLLNIINSLINSYRCSPEELEKCEELPFWFTVQLLISQSDLTLLSPHTSVNWSLDYYSDWFIKQTNSSRLNFLLSFMHSYNSSVISSESTKYVENYPFIMNILQKQVTYQKL